MHRRRAPRAARWATRSISGSSTSISRSEVGRSAPVKIEWDGVYFDGRSAQRQPGTVRPVTDGLRITLDNGTAFSWPYSEIRQVQGVYRGQQVRLERGATPETLVVPDVEFLTALNQAEIGRASCRERG